MKSVKFIVVSIIAILILFGINLLELNILVGSFILFSITSLLLNPPTIENLFSTNENRELLRKHLLKSIQFITMNFFIIGSMILLQLANNNFSIKKDTTLGWFFIGFSIFLIIKKRGLVLNDKLRT